MSVYRKYILVVLAVLLLVAVGVVIGHYTKGSEKAEEAIEQATKPVVVVNNSHVIHDTIYQPQIVREIKYIPQTVTVTDTVFIQQLLDTMSVVNDYYRQRTYDLDFSSDSVGTFEVEVEVSQNKLASAISTISVNQTSILAQPQTQFQKHQQRTYNYFVTVGANHNFDIAHVTGGIVFNRRWIIGATLLHWDDYNYAIDLGIQF